MRYRWFNEDAESFMRNNEAYLRNDESLEQRVEQIATRAFREIYKSEDYYNKFIDYMSKGYISLSTPVWSNFGRKGQLAISCFGSYIEDSMESILGTVAEVGTMSKYGGGTSAYVGNLRPRGAKISKGGTSDGAVHFCKLFESTVNACKQGSQRRGSMSVTLPIEHLDINEFIKIRHESSEVQDLFPAISIGDEWFQQMLDGDSEKRKLWASILQSRQRVGTPFIFFRDNVNNQSPEIYKYTGQTIQASNLCMEISLCSNEHKSFVCCLASLNALYFDEWKETDVVEVLVAFLDTVLTDFIETAKNIKFLEKAVNFAREERAIGIGGLGFHSYLQSKMIPFESIEAKIFNEQLFKFIKERSSAESKRLGEELGYAPIFEAEGFTGEKFRHVTRMAIAPTSSSSFILGQVSQGIEPYRSNYYTRDMAKKKIIFKNPYLEKIINERVENPQEVWDEILKNFGSVQKIDCLTDHEKEVFKTFSEISQLEVINQAAQRQVHIDQSQSLNIMLHPKTPAKDIHQLMVHAHMLGVKTLYYHHSISALQEYTNTIVCSSCEA